MKRCPCCLDELPDAVLGSHLRRCKEEVHSKKFMQKVAKRRRSLELSRALELNRTPGIRRPAVKRVAIHMECPYCGENFTGQEAYAKAHMNMVHDLFITKIQDIWELKKDSAVITKDVSKEEVIESITQPKTMESRPRWDIWKEIARKGW